jgi:hypothetical protein
MDQRKVSCCKHGNQPMAIACIHVCRAIESRSKVGFFWSTDTNGPRPDAWCLSCEQWSLAHPNDKIEEWMKVADFQFLCVECWDEAKNVICGR